MAIPDYETLMLPVLKLAAASPDRELVTSEVTKELADQFGLTQEERVALLPSGGTFVFSSRVSWACTYLKKAAALVAPKRGRIKITERGLDLVASGVGRVDNEVLERFEEFRQFRSRDKKVAPTQLVPGISTPVGTPEEVIASQHELVRSALATQLLDLVKSCTPQFFEQLVIDLLVRMGYGGSREDAGTAVGRSGDGGIDGVIKEDRLGLDMVYVQAKRWDDKAVGSPQIDQFAGALQKKKATKGVFITTSTFTADALKSVSEYPIRIVLLDGEALANLMMDFDLGVTVTTIYQVKRVDSDYFADGLGDV